MKKFALLFLAAFFSMATALAQGPPSKQGPNENVNEIAKKNEKEMKKFNKKKHHLKLTSPGNHESKATAKAKNKS